MRGKIYYLVILLVVFNSAAAQEVSWVKKRSDSGHSKGLLCDRLGNIYDYWSEGWPSYWQSGGGGSFLDKYSPEGQLIYSKRWNFPFYIQQMVYDGNAYFYFTGAFSGTSTIDGITISSRGGVDGVAGRMDMDGKIRWMSTFGGDGNDAGYGLCISGSTLIVTGGIDDTLYVNHAYKAAGNKAAFIGTFTLNGAMSSHRLYDFLPFKDWENKGREICAAGSGEYYWLVDREGRHWNGDSINAPIEGRYIIKLNSSLDTVWSAYITGPGCYYGWSCNSLRVSAAGDPYVLRYCSGKYGGTGEIVRFNRVSGQEVWSHGFNSDLGYSDIYIDGNTVFLIGNEGAAIYPGPGSHAGYQVIKKFDSNNQPLGETRLARVNTCHITKDGSGNFFVSGAFRERYGIVGGDTLVADSTSFGSYYTYMGGFLAKLRDVNCTPVEVKASVPKFYNHGYIFCPGNSVTLTATDSLFDYRWSNGATSRAIQVDRTGTFIASARNGHGCVSYSLPAYTAEKEAGEVPQLCMVTYDSVAKRNTLLWKMIFDYGTRHIKIYKAARDGKFHAIDMIPYINYYNTITYTDSLSDPSAGHAVYALSTVDTCGNESELSMPHRTMYLQVRKTGSGNSLDWTPYEGFDFTAYYIYRGTGEGDLAFVDSVGASSTTFNDKTNGDYYYQVKVKKAYQCYYSSFVPPQYASSNLAKPLSAPAADVPSQKDSALRTARVFPNPASDQLIVELDGEEKYELVLRNILGETVRTVAVSGSNRQVDLRGLSSGVYTVTLKQGEVQRHFTILKN
jgi:hypothetical protein